MSSGTRLTQSFAHNELAETPDKLQSATEYCIILLQRKDCVYLAYKSVVFDRLMLEQLNKFWYLKIVSDMQSNQGAMLTVAAQRLFVCTAIIGHRKKSHQKQKIETN